MNRILCSTGALLRYGGNYKILEPLSRQLMCDGYEFMMDRPYYRQVEALTDYFQKIKLYIPVVHCEKSIGEHISKGGRMEWGDACEKFEINCDIAKSIGAEKIVIHLWDGRTSDSNFHNNLTGYYHLNEISRRYGLDLLVENVVCNVENPMKHFCELRENYPDIHFVFDTKMAAFHGQLNLLYATEYSWLWQEGHICHYHVNDYSGGHMDWENLRSLPIGTGTIDFPHFFEFLNQIGYDGFLTVEATAHNDEGVVDVRMLNEQFRYIRTHLI
ncbi:MAG: sugar phosphate isomerase/epimerase [Lachnospiraceae bacterium]|nr:sugar phosphate isomerase/epimerase [Lachnospiraceae bacterium]